MENEHGSPPSPQVKEFENGIFNLAVALVQNLSQTYQPEAARLYVVAYLERLAEGLKSIPNEKERTNEH